MEQQTKNSVTGKIEYAGDNGQEEQNMIIQDVGKDNNEVELDNTNQLIENEKKDIVEKGIIAALELPKNYGQNLTPETLEIVESLKASIDIRSLTSINNFGAKFQTGLGDFADNMIKNKGLNDLGEAGNILEEAVTEIMGYNIELKPSRIPWRNNVARSKKKIKKLQLRYASVSTNVENVAKELAIQENKLKIANSEVQNMYKLSAARIRELEVIIYAGEQVLIDEQAKLQELMQNQNLVEDMGKTQELQEYTSNLHSFETRLYDLRTSRATLMNQMVQAYNTYKSSDEIQGTIRSIINNTIPLWKQQLALAVCMNVVQTAAQACNSAKDATNKLLIANSETCKNMTIESTRLAERPIVDISTLNKLNNDTITALQEKYKIIQRAKAERESGIEQMKKNEEQLRQEVAKYANIYVTKE